MCIYLLNVYPESPGCTFDKGKQCPGPSQSKCSDYSCKGNDQNKCTNEHKDCDCQPYKCPDKEQLKCSNDTRHGDDQNKCTEQQHKDCECIPDKCPDGKDIPFCCECGGNDDKWQVCKNLVKGTAATDCPCNSFRLDKSLGGCKPGSFDDLAAIAAGYSFLAKFGPGDWFDGSLDEAAKCQELSLTAPQRDGDGIPSV